MFSFSNLLLVHLQVQLRVSLLSFEDLHILFVLLVLVLDCGRRLFLCLVIGFRLIDDSIRVLLLHLFSSSSFILSFLFIPFFFLFIQGSTLLGSLPVPLGLDQAPAVFLAVGVDPEFDVGTLVYSYVFFLLSFVDLLNRVR